MCDITDKQIQLIDNGCAEHVPSAHIDNVPWCLPHHSVANRVNVIRESTIDSRWFHVPGAQNLSNVASRDCCAMSPKEMWFDGPQFLQQFEDKWHSESYICDFLPEDIEVRYVSTLAFLFLLYGAEFQSWRYIWKTLALCAAPGESVLAETAYVLTE